MARIFNSIRQRLLAQNLPDRQAGRFTRYLIYAVGEIVLVVIGILIALQINLWKEDRKSVTIEHNILKEINNGLAKDLADIAHNQKGHANGIRSCAFWNKVIHGQEVNTDSLDFYYWYLTRSFTLAQNTASYGSLKSRGLELISNDSLRLQITNLYDVEYVPMKALEETYSETQFHEAYQVAINRIMAPLLAFNEAGELVSVNTSVQLGDDARNELMSYLWRITRKRQHVLKNYVTLEEMIQQLRTRISEELATRPN